MINPLLESKKYLLVYMVLWAVVIVAHTLLLYSFYELSFIIALKDSLTYNLIFMILGFGVWYIVAYNPFDIRYLGRIIFVHLFSALFLIGLWFSVAGLLTGIFLGEIKLSEPFKELVPVRTVLGVIYYLLIAIVYYLLIYAQNFKESVNREAKLEAKFKEAELNALKAQINPHFIFNSLNSISSLTLSDPGTAQEMIVKLSEFFRMTLKKDNTQYTDLSDEIAFSKLYFEIEKIRFGERLEFTIDCEEKEHKVKVPHLILQPLLENAIKHGVQESIGKVVVLLTCHVEEQFLILKIRNQFDAEAVRHGQGIGHQNIKERLRLIYGRTDLFNVKIKGNEYAAILKIPLY